MYMKWMEMNSYNKIYLVIMFQKKKTDYTVIDLMLKNEVFRNRFDSWFSNNEDEKKYNNCWTGTYNFNELKIENNYTHIYHVQLH